MMMWVLSQQERICCGGVSYWRVQLVLIYLPFIDVLKSPGGNAERFVLTLEYRHIDDLMSFTLHADDNNVQGQ